MADLDLNDRLDFIEFRQELLYENSPFSRLLFHYKFTRQQYNSLLELLDEYREKIDNNEKVVHSTFENRIYAISEECKRDYHFVESLTRHLYDAGRYEEIFVALYGGLAKYKYLFEEQR
ncbi:DUF1878 domain-containing protein [Brevibacillus laterosporus]|uniref:DUF1878 domain-containing protein n=1 Tax=Brevibacillus laterosporus TaxID=1465 RepID=UPI000CE3F25F|nr:DUF1878 domain-containing protein [Brevibacillus laterosporus]PPA87912.1 DUF1878 domain-containing protein [Brevibacillus laterosporus]